MKQKKNYSLINCFKKSFQILKKGIKKRRYKFKELAKKNPTKNNKQKDLK